MKISMMLTNQVGRGRLLIMTIISHQLRDDTLSRESNLMSIDWLRMLINLTVIEFRTLTIIWQTWVSIMTFLKLALVNPCNIKEYTLVFFTGTSICHVPSKVAVNNRELLCFMEVVDGISQIMHLICSCYIQTLLQPALSKIQIAWDTSVKAGCLFG